MLKNVILSILVVIVATMGAVAVSAAQDGKLIITDIDVKVGGSTDKNLDDGDSVSDEAKPGDDIEFKIEFTNNYTDEEDLEIEDIDVTVTIEGIDDGDDLDEDANSFDLRPGRDKRVTVSFDIPWEVGDDTFDVVIEADGKDENNTDQTRTATLTFEVEKEKDELIVRRATLSPEQMQCSRSGTLAVNVLNIGEEDQEDATIQVVNSQLGIDMQDTFDVISGEFDDEQEYSKTFRFDVAEDVPSGTYPIDVIVNYNDDRDSERETRDLIVNECVVEEEEEEPVEEIIEEEPFEDTTVIIEQPSNQAPIIVPPVTTPVVTPQDEGGSSAFGNSGVLIGIGIFNVILIIIIVVVVIFLLRR